MKNRRNLTNKIVTLMGVFQCLTLLLPLGFYKIEPPSSYVGTLWGFLVAPAYITLIAGLLLIFRKQIQTYLDVKADKIIIFSGIMTFTTFFSAIILNPLTQKAIMEFHQFINSSGTITYLDVEAGGLFTYFQYGLGLFYIGLGVTRYNRFSVEDLKSEEVLV